MSDVGMIRPRTKRRLMQIKILLNRGQEPKQIALRLRVSVWTVYKIIEKCHPGLLLVPGEGVCTAGEGGR